MGSLAGEALPASLTPTIDPEKILQAEPDTQSHRVVGIYRVHYATGIKNLSYFWLGYARGLM